MKNLKFTPLTLVVACCVTYAFYLLLGFDTPKEGVGVNSKVFFTLLLALILWLTDLLFRRFVLDKRWLWLIQGSFIILIILMILIFQTI
ncbi:hypothetical protein [Pedobacter puniceum]|jgi:hypothetical protein|uniref:Uncharacterized protein n=1 Tax=Pedobacter puniceum TaxID=2666136 RepID=A0A7K0FQZ2_9SPHI|nr:hypothetical protein [Pedobacter puniceum]MRX48406.1 hypothetical protein [Pedobacter puniceum]